jgi:phosphoesterase RecJ-like protein
LSHTLISRNTGEVFRKLREEKLKIALMVHVNPDGDALGSALAMSRMLTRMGHHCNVISPNDFPAFLKWMPGAPEVCLVSEQPKKAVGIVKDADIIFVLDFNEPKRITRLADAYAGSTAYRILIDHHPAPEMEADCILSDTSVSSTAELVYRFLEEGNLMSFCDTETAACLFTGIMTDTGCFSHNSSDPKTYMTVAALLNKGIDKDEIYHAVFDNYSAARMHLLGYVLHEKMVVLPEYNTAYLYLSKEDQARFEFRVGDSEGFVNYPLSIGGIRFSVLFMEKEDYVKVSLRSRGSFAVNEVSKKYFSGGGHRNAAGGDSFASLEETITRFRALLPEYHDALCADEE